MSKDELHPPRMMLDIVEPSEMGTGLELRTQMELSAELFSLTAFWPYCPFQLHLTVRFLHM